MCLPRWTSGTLGQGDSSRLSYAKAVDAHRITRGRLRPVKRPLNTRQTAVLEYVHQHPGCTSGTGAASLSMRTTTFRRIAEGLYARNLLRRDVQYYAPPAEDGGRNRPCMQQDLITSPESTELGAEPDRWHTEFVHLTWSKSNACGGASPGRPLLPILLHQGFKIGATFSTTASETINIRNR